MNEKKVAVIGSGLMGGGIAQLCAQSGFETVNVDIAPEPLERAQALVDRLLSGKVAKGKMTQDEKDAVMGRLSYSTDFADIADAAVVVEAVPERLDVKKATFASIDEHADPDAVLLTNTSGLSVSAIASATARPGSVMGMHFFYPAPVMRLVELVRGLATTDETYARAAAFAEAIGKEAIDAPELPGFVVNRLIVPYQNEGAFLVMEGVAPEDVDRGMKLGCNHPMGPCELMDFTGIDVVLATMRGLYEQFGDSKYRPAPILQTMVDAGRLGRKTGRGFYDYSK
ncbi:3-hydroxyacyl-CoA dehydrogenase NAD-binding domain-containing protein [Atopobiaceae bacterium 24-176]